MAATKESTEKLDLNLKHLFEYGVSLQSRTIQLVGEIDQEKFQLIDKALTEMERQNQKSVVLRINSEGGSVYDALAIIGRLENSKCRVITEGYGCVMSAATLVLAAGGKRRVSRRAWFMHHESSYDTEGRHSEIKEIVKQKEREEAQWAEVMAEYTDKSTSFWKKNGITQDAYFTAEELLGLGVVDEIF